MRFMNKVLFCPNHRLSDEVLFQIFYQLLDFIIKSVENNLAGGSLMERTFGLVKALLKRMTKTNQAWHTRNIEVTLGVTSSIMTNEMRKKKEEIDEKIVKMMTQLNRSQVCERYWSSRSQIPQRR